MKEITPEVTGKKRASASSTRRRLMFRRKVCSFFSCSSPTLWNWMRLRGFPRPIVCEGKDAWWEDEILAWAESKPRRKFKTDPPVEEV